MMRILIVGMGNIGTRHLKNLRTLLPDAEIIVCHHGKNRRDFPKLPLADTQVYGLREAVELEPNAAIISNPSAFHVENALELARHRIHLFIEKPLSNSLEHVNKLLDECRKQDVRLMVGYNFRFYEPFLAIRRALADGEIGRVVSIRAEAGQFLPHWRPDVDYRLSSSAVSGLGGGVVLELSHELDYVRWLVGEVKTVTAQLGKLSDLEIDVEDIAEIILEFCNGALGNIHIDMVDRSKTRGCRVVGTEGTIVWTGFDNSVKMFGGERQLWQQLSPPADFDLNEMYKAELEHFLTCIRDGTTPSVDGNDGLRVLQIAVAVKRSSKERRTIDI